MDSIYSEITLTTLPRMKVARYVVISPQPEDDAIAHMDVWAKASGLLDLPGYTPRKFGWDFEYVSEEQREKFHLRGYVYLYTIPEEFVADFEGVELTYLEADEYAALRITEPFVNPFERIPAGWKVLCDFVLGSEYRPTRWDNRNAMEEVVVENGVTYMDLYFPVR